MDDSNFDQAKAYMETIAEQLAALSDDGAGLDAIYETPLSVSVREGWHAPGEPGEASEYEILLCTGGPAVRVRGALAGGCPVSAALEQQDWYTPWAEYRDADADALLRWASCFYFGD